MLGSELSNLLDGSWSSLLEVNTVQLDVSIKVEGYNEVI